MDTVSVLLVIMKCNAIGVWKFVLQRCILHWQVTLNTLLTGLRSPGVPSAAWDAIILTRTWQDLENFDWRIASGTLKKNERVREKKEILFQNLQRSFVIQLNETIISTNVYCRYILLHFELPQIKAYENFKLITIFLIIRSWVQIPYKPEFFTRPSFHYCFSSVHNCEDCFHIHVFIGSSNIWLSYIHRCLFTDVYSPLHGFIWNQHSDQLPVGLLAQLVEHCIRLRVQIPYRPEFFSGLLFTTA